MAKIKEQSKMFEWRRAELENELENLKSKGPSTKPAQVLKPKFTLGKRKEEPKSTPRTRV